MITLAVIPARGGSKGVIRKNIRMLCDKPLMCWTIEAALACPAIDRVVVSTDDSEIASVAKQYNAKAGYDLAPFLRPAELATDRAPTLPVIQHAVRFLEEQLGKRSDCVALLQPTTPLRQSSSIELGLKKMTETGCDSVVSVVDVEGQHPFRMKRLVDGDRLINFIDQGFEDMRPRQVLPAVYIREGSIYMAKRELVMEQNALVGGDVRAVVIDPKNAVNIDTEFDFERAERLLKQRLK